MEAICKKPNVSRLRMMFLSSLTWLLWLGVGVGGSLVLLMLLHRTRPRRHFQSTNSISSTNDVILPHIGSISGRRVSCSTRGVVLEFDSYHRPHIIEGAVPVLQQLARHTDLYLITECDDNNEEEAVLGLLSKQGILAAGLNPYKVLFCSTTMGRVHVVRQIESHMHIDGNESVVQALCRHVSRLALVGGINQNAGHVQNARTLADLFYAEEVGV